MTVPTIDTIKPIYSASNALAAIGNALGEIRQQDGLTWGEMGRVLGKSDDQAAKYADGSAEMGVVAFGLAKREWNGRFTGPFDRLCVGSRPGPLNDHTAHSAVLRGALAMSEALQNGNQIYDWEVKANRAALEAARDALEELLAKASA